MSYKWKGDNYIDAMEKAKSVALEAGIIDMHGQAVLLQSPDTGNLRGSLSWTVAGKHGGLNSAGDNASADQGVNVTQESDEAYLGTNVDYSIYVEFGTSKMAAQPYLRPAYDARKEHTKQIMEDHFRKAIKGVGG